MITFCPKYGFPPIRSSLFSRLFIVVIRFECASSFSICLGFINLPLRARLDIIITCKNTLKSSKCCRCQIDKLYYRSDIWYTHIVRTDGWRKLSITLTRWHVELTHMPLMYVPVPDPGLDSMTFDLGLRVLNALRSIFFIP